MSENHLQCVREGRIDLGETNRLVFLCVLVFAGPTLPQICVSQGAYGTSP